MVCFCFLRGLYISYILFLIYPKFQKVCISALKREKRQLDVIFSFLQHTLYLQGYILNYSAEQQIKKQLLFVIDVFNVYHTSLLLLILIPNVCFSYRYATTQPPPKAT